MCNGKMVNNRTKKNGSEPLGCGSLDGVRFLVEDGCSGLAARAAKYRNSHKQNSRLSRLFWMGLREAEDKRAGNFRISSTSENYRSIATFLILLTILSIMLWMNP